MKKRQPLFLLLTLLILCSITSAIAYAGEVASDEESDPRALAEKALRAYQMKDIEGYQKLLLRPLPFGTSLALAFPHAPEMLGVEKPKGFYLLDKQKIAAVITAVPDDPRSIWFEIVPTRQGRPICRGGQSLATAAAKCTAEVGGKPYRGGFAISGLIVSGKNPPMDIELEENDHPL